MRTIKLGYGVLLRAGHCDYKVITVKNSTDYHPGQILRREEVDTLCNNLRWDVVIVPLVESREKA